MMHGKPSSNSDRWYKLHCEELPNQCYPNVQIPFNQLIDLTAGSVYQQTMEVFKIVREHKSPFCFDCSTFGLPKKKKVIYVYLTLCKVCWYIFKIEACKQMVSGVAQMQVCMI